jgi:hypothetical protein
MADRQAGEQASERSCMGNLRRKRMRSAAAAAIAEGKGGLCRGIGGRQRQQGIKAEEGESSSSWHE